MRFVQNWILKPSEMTFKLQRIRNTMNIRKMHREKICSRQVISGGQTDERTDGRTGGHACILIILCRPLSGALISLYVAKDGTNLSGFFLKIAM